jgi:hypothetical protein
MAFGGGSSSNSISNSSDAALNNPVNGDVLTYSTGAKWTNKSITAAGVSKLPENVNTVASSGATETLPDVTVATIHSVTLTANCTFTFPAAAAGKSFLLVLLQDSTGNRLAIWPGTVQWQNSLAPTLTTTASKKDAFSFICVDGTNWLGLTVGQNF